MVGALTAALVVVAGLAVTTVVDRGLPDLAWPSWLPRWAATSEPGETPVDPGDVAPDLLVPLSTLDLSTLDDEGLRWIALLDEARAEPLLAHRLGPWRPAPVHRRPRRPDRWWT